MLKHCWGIAQAERYSTISKCPKWTCKRSFFLVLRCNRDLVIPRVTVQETVILVTRQTFKHLINEGKWKMVLTSCSIQLPMVDANSDLHGKSSLDQLFVLVFHYGEIKFLWNRVDRTNPLAIKNGIDYLIV